MKVLAIALLAVAAVSADRPLGRSGPGQSYGAPQRNGGASQSYGAPQRNGGASQSYGAPQGSASQSYGAPQGSASQSYGAPQTSYGAGQEEFPPQPYSFEYEVKDDEGNDYGHKEESDGSRVEGVYRVLLPDTRVQTVTYYVEGDSGFVADVQYEGEAQFPEDSQNGQYGAAAPNNGYGAPAAAAAPVASYSQPAAPSGGYGAPNGGARTPSTGYGF
ncbi:pro-resilin-like isoform X1 [Amphibalanus amphitrite]|uniref:pro-resilin-like isoform X1 n=1 Tax=Amphibalanus amphitrite TaxID=1232801 RepID=UPI001C916EE4|nr:pro-resilin-like isoform X1 [Amphibalanus amphitrite]